MQKKGISLIVLVITIIVMIILAAAIIISLNNTGIISNANKAVDETNEKTVQDIANLAWGEAYANGKRTRDELQAVIDQTLESNNISKDDYTVYATEKGVEIGKGWLQTSDKKVVKGNQVLEIGDIINYEDKAGENGTKKYTGNWAILGAEDGKILIMSTANVDMKFYNESKTLETAKAEYITLIDDLNEICEAYGTGKGAIGARSIKAEDLFSVSYIYYKIYGFRKGDKVTLYWDTTSENQEYPYYEISNGKNGNLSWNHSSFIYFDGKEWKESKMPEALPTEKQKICTLTFNMYSNSAAGMGLTSSEKISNMFFDGVSYWLATRTCDNFGMSPYICFGMQFVWRSSGKDRLDRVSCVRSDSSAGNRNMGVRAVITLNPDIKLSGSSDAGWTIN